MGASSAGRVARFFVAAFTMSAIIAGLGSVAAADVLEQMAGRWGEDCTGGLIGTWTVRKNEIEFSWPPPSTSSAVERVERIEGNEVYTIVVSSENSSYRGARFHYTVTGDTVRIEGLSGPA